MVSTNSKDVKVSIENSEGSMIEIVNDLHFIKVNEVVIYRAPWYRKHWKKIEKLVKIWVLFWVLLFSGLAIYQTFFGVLAK